VRNLASVGGNLFAPAPYGDFTVALLALDAQVVVQSGFGSGRATPLEEFLAARERMGPALVAAIQFPRPASPGDFHFRKISRVKPKGISVLSIAAHLPLAGGRVSQARVAYGAMAPTPIRARDGSLYFKVAAPEGERAIALYDWAPGRKFGECLDEAMAARIGAEFARMHLLGLEYAGNHVFTTEDVVGFLVNVPTLLEFLYDRPDDARDYAVIAERLARRLQDILAEFAPTQVTPRHIAQIRRSMADTYAVANRTITVLRLVFDYALEEQLIEANPCVGIKRLAQHTRTRRILPGE
jgi:hypothetical protein